MMKILEKIKEKGIKMPTIQLLRSGQITLPTMLREILDLNTGDLLETEVKKGRVVLTPVKTIPMVELSKQGEEMLKQALEDVKKGRAKTFNNLRDLAEDLYEKNN
ncbi:AbrB/MazE/SpoVT family DNA-binding domain-containing protein [Patescibacteria group bacterium]|nr:AbrB/MazE/SpoVT family DNA-binding domain-containing protein [Patescibacteria group bacterium]